MPGTHDHWRDRPLDAVLAALPLGTGGDRLAPALAGVATLGAALDLAWRLSGPAMPAERDAARALATLLGAPDDPSWGNPPWIPRDVPWPEDPAILAEACSAWPGWDGDDALDAAATALHCTGFPSTLLHKVTRGDVRIDEAGLVVSHGPRPVEHRIAVGSPAFAVLAPLLRDRPGPSRTPLFRSDVLLDVRRRRLSARNRLADAARRRGEPATHPDAWRDRPLPPAGYRADGHPADARSLVFLAGFPDLGAVYDAALGLDVPRESHLPQGPFLEAHRLQRWSERLRGSAVSVDWWSVAREDDDPVAAALPWPAWGRDDARDAAAAALSVLAGASDLEIHQAVAGDVSVVGGVVATVRLGRGGRRRIVPCATALADALSRWLAERRPLPHHPLFTHGLMAIGTTTRRRVVAARLRDRDARRRAGEAPPVGWEPSVPTEASPHASLPPAPVAAPPRPSAVPRRDELDLAVAEALAWAPAADRGKVASSLASLREALDGLSPAAAHWSRPLVRKWLRATWERGLALPLSRRPNELHASLRDALPSWDGWSRPRHVEASLAEVLAWIPEGTTAHAHAVVMSRFLAILAPLWRAADVVDAHALDLLPWPRWTRHQGHLGWTRGTTGAAVAAVAAALRADPPPPDHPAAASSPAILSRLMAALGPLSAEFHDVVLDHVSLDPAKRRAALRLRRGDRLCMIGVAPDPSSRDGGLLLASAGSSPDGPVQLPDPRSVVAHMAAHAPVPDTDATRVHALVRSAAPERFSTRLASDGSILLLDRTWSPDFDGDLSILLRTADEAGATLHLGVGLAVPAARALDHGFHVDAHLADGVLRRLPS